jgi:hypothetical protein
MHASPALYHYAICRFQIHRLKKDFEEMWVGASEEVREAYGREYLRQHEDMVEEVAATACQDIGRVTDAMVHALFATNPKTRYLVPGSSGWIDLYWVCRPTILSW